MIYDADKLVARFNWASGQWRDPYSKSRVLRACPGCGGPTFSRDARVLCRPCRMQKESDQRKVERAALHKLGLIQPKGRKPATSYKQAQRRAIALVSVAKVGGVLPYLNGKIKCVDCGRPARIYDHRDYSKPLDVEAVCDQCNGRRGPGLWQVPSLSIAQGQR